ncbi:MAG: sigma-70 family RNA polymerase sigma factor [Planctomycetota bacterium]
MTPASPPPDDPVQDTFELVARAQQGDRRAVEEILGRYYPRVLSVVRSRLGPGLRQFVESDDLVQETMIEVVKSFEGFDMRDERALIRWMSYLVENRIRDTAKFFGAKKRDGKRVALQERGGLDSGDVPVDPPLVDSGPTPVERAERSELSDRVRAGLERLEPRYREVIERFNGRERWAAIALAMGLPTAGAARRMHARARVKLARVLATELDEGDA